MVRKGGRFNPRGSSPTAGHPGFPPPPFMAELEERLASPTAQLCALLFQGFLVLVAIAMLIIQQIQFKETWGRYCDYNQKVWATVWVSRALVQYFILFVTTFLVIKSIKPGMVVVLRRFQSAISILK